MVVVDGQRVEAQARDGDAVETVRGRIGADRQSGEHAVVAAGEVGQSGAAVVHDQAPTSEVRVVLGIRQTGMCAAERVNVPAAQPPGDLGGDRGRAWSTASDVPAWMGLNPVRSTVLR